MIVSGEESNYRVPVSARQFASEVAYQEAKGAGETVPLDQEPHLIDWHYWYLVKNRFPYDMIFEAHEMLLPKSGVSYRSELTDDEVAELDEILGKLSGQYDLYFENFNHRRSVQDIYHLHVARYHQDRKAINL